MFSYSYEPYNITSYIFLYIIYVVYIYVCTRYINILLRVHIIQIYIKHTTFYEYYVTDTMIHIKILFGEEQEYYIRICII